MLNKKTTILFMFLLVLIPDVLLASETIKTVSQTISQIGNQSEVANTIKGVSAIGAIYLGLQGAGIIGDDNKMNIKKLGIASGLTFIATKYQTILSTIVSLFEKGA